MSIDELYNQIKIATDEVKFARLQRDSANTQVAAAERKLKDLVTQLAKASGVRIGNNSKYTKNTYTAEEDNKLKDLWAANHTAREIAEILGKKPSSVNSRISRLGLSRRPRVVREAA